MQPKIADGTFVIKNSSEAMALQDKATLTRDEMAKIIGQVTTNWDLNTAKNLAEANLTVATAADKGKSSSWPQMTARTRHRRCLRRRHRRRQPT